MALSDHEFDETDFCVQCGQAMMDIVDKRLLCYEGVIAISHITAKRRMIELFKRVCTEGYA